MRRYLMNKNRKVALVELSRENTINEIFEIFDIDYAPLSLKNANSNKIINNVKALNNWFLGRGIPSWRKDIESLLDNLKISSPNELLDKAYGLSLSDQFWIKEETQDIKWEDINFFTNDFKYKGYLKLSLSSSNFNEEIDLYSPNNTTDGMLQKAWIIENKKRILVKGTYSPSRQEPLNEWLVSQICKRLEIDYCNYDVDIMDNKIVSKCEDFINENEEIITAYDIFNSETKSNNMNDLEHYIGILEKNQVPNARKKVQDMILIDFIVMNFDRHLRNFGIVRNVENLKWERVTPIFDTGESMQCDKLLSEMNFYDDRCKFFTNTNKKISELTRYINFSEYDFSKLKDLPSIFKEKIIEYKNYTDMSDERINKLYEGISYRISKLLDNSIIK